MASTYGNDLRLEEIGDGEQSGSWGATTNTNLELIAEALSFGTEAITTNANTHTTTIADGATDPGRSLYLKYTGTLDSACTITIAPNSISKTWYIENGTSGSQSIIISQGSGANVTIKTGQTKIVYSDGAGSGAAMAEIGTLGVSNLAVDTNATIGGTLGVTGVLTGTSLDISGNVDIDGVTNLDAVDIDGAVQLDATLTVGANDQGYDVILYGDTAARNATWDSSADSLIFTDNTKAVFGTGSDATILFDGTDMKVGATAGHLDLFTSEVGSSVRILGSGESLAEFTDDGDVDLFHNGTLKMSTTASGITVAGSVVDNLTRGSIKVGNSSGVFAELAKGSAGTVLTSDGTDLSFAAAAASAGVLSKTATGAIAIRRAVQIRNDGNAEQVQLSATGDLPVVENEEVTYTTTGTGYSYYGIAVNAAYTEFVHAYQGGSGKIVACTLNANGTVTTSSESSWAADPATNSNYQYGGVSTASRAYVFGIYGNNGQAYVRGAYTTGNAGSVSVVSANTIAINGGASSGQWEIGTTEEGYFFVVKYQSSNVYIKFGSQNPSNGQISLASGWTQIASNYGETNRGVGVDQVTKKVVVISTSNASTNADIYVTTIQRGSGTASGTKSATVDGGWNTSSYGGISVLGLAQDGATNKMVFTMQYGKEGQGGTVNNSYGVRAWFTVIDTSGTNPVWNNKNSSNDLYDYPVVTKTNKFGVSRPYGLDSDGARFTTGNADSIIVIRTNGTEAGTSVAKNSFQPSSSTTHMALYKQDGSGISVSGDSSSSGTVIRYGFANLGAVVGISSNAVSNGGTVEIDTVGGKSSGHSSLSPSKQYYAKPSDGTLVTTQASPGQQSIGLAISATEILIGVE